MSRIKRIHIPITGVIGAGSGVCFSATFQAWGKLVGLMFRPTGPQVSTVTVDADGGTFTLTRNSQTSGTIAANATANTVQTALNSAWGTGVVVVARTGSVNAYVYTLTFSGTSYTQSAGVITRKGAATYYYVSTDASLLTGGAGTATSVDVSGMWTATGDMVIVDNLSQATLFSTGDTTAIPTYIRPSKAIAPANSFTAITAAAGHSIDADIYVTGFTTINIHNLLAGDTANLWLIVEST